MAKKELTMLRLQEIKRLIGMGISYRKISQSLKCSRNIIRKIKEGEIGQSKESKPLPAPLWRLQVGWDDVLKNIQDGHPIKYIWDEKLRDIVSYTNFWKQVCKKFPELQSGTSTHREFEPGEHCEVDYAGKKVEWVDIRTGAVNDAVSFIGVLGSSNYV